MQESIHSVPIVDIGCPSAVSRFDLVEDTAQASRSIFAATLCHEAVTTTLDSANQLLNLPI
jgi:hypothetical protein